MRRPVELKGGSAGRPVDELPVPQGCHDRRRAALVVRPWSPRCRAVLHPALEGCARGRRLDRPGLQSLEEGTARISCCSTRSTSRRALSSRSACRSSLLPASTATSRQAASWGWLPGFRAGEKRRWRGTPDKEPAASAPKGMLGIAASLLLSAALVVRPSASRCLRHRGNGRARRAARASRSSARRSRCCSRSYWGSRRSPTSASSRRRSIRSPGTTRRAAGQPALPAEHARADGACSSSACSGWRSTSSDGSQMRAVLATAVVWVLGRWAFWAGYHLSSTWRARRRAVDAARPARARLRRLARRLRRRRHRWGPRLCWSRFLLFEGLLFWKTATAASGALRGGRGAIEESDGRRIAGARGSLAVPRRPALAQAGAVASRYVAMRWQWLNPEINSFTFRDTDKVFESPPGAARRPGGTLERGPRAGDAGRLPGRSPSGTFTNALLVIRHGRIVFEDYRNHSDDDHALHRVLDGRRRSPRC